MLLIIPESSKSPAKSAGAAPVSVSALLTIFLARYPGAFKRRSNNAGSPAEPPEMAIIHEALVVGVESLSIVECPGANACALIAVPCVCTAVAPCRVMGSAVIPISFEGVLSAILFVDLTSIK